VDDSWKKYGIAVRLPAVDGVDGVSAYIRDGELHITWSARDMAALYDMDSAMMSLFSKSYTRDQQGGSASADH
jgi:hypothetical protein